MPKNIRYQTITVTATISPETYRISTTTADDTIAVSESSSGEEEGEVDDLIETEFARDVRVRGGPKLERRKEEFHSASSSSNASSSVQR